MLDPTKPVYLGEVITRNDEKTIVWNRTEAYNQQLDESVDSSVP